MIDRHTKKPSIHLLVVAELCRLVPVFTPHHIGAKSSIKLYIKVLEMLKSKLMFNLHLEGLEQKVGVVGLF